MTKLLWWLSDEMGVWSLSTEVPVDIEWTSILYLPTVWLLLIKVYPSTNSALYCDKVYTDTKDALYADYIYNVPESEWPVYFSKMIE